MKKRKIFKNMVAWLICLVMVLTTINLPAFSTEVKAENAVSGKCGDDATWSFDVTTGELVISGSGKMYDFESYYASKPNGNYAGWRGYASSIKSVVIEEGITYIGTEAFEECINITYMYIPWSVKAVGNDFLDCAEGMTARFNLEYYGSEYQWNRIMNAAPLNDTVKMYASLNARSYGEKCGDLVYWNLNQDDGIVRIYGYGKMKDDRSFDEYSYMSFKSGWNTIIVEEGVTYISKNAFCTNVIAPAKNLYIADSVESIGENAFYYAALENVYFGENSKLTTIGEAAFSNTNIKNIVLPDKVTTLEKEAFYETPLESITIPMFMTHIGDSAFLDTNITKVTYKGNEDQWNGLMRESYRGYGNEVLLDANVTCLREKDSLGREYVTFLPLSFPEIDQIVDGSSVSDYMNLSIPKELEEKGVHTSMEGWHKINEDGFTTELSSVSGKFGEGQYQYITQLRIDNRIWDYTQEKYVPADFGTRYLFDPRKDFNIVTFNGEPCVVESVNVYEDYSSMIIHSPIITVTKDDSLPLEVAGYINISKGYPGTAIKNVDLSAHFTGGVGPYTYEMIDAPSWMRIEKGLLMGTPTKNDAAGKFTFQIQVTDSLGATITIPVTHYGVFLKTEDKTEISKIVGTTNQDVVVANGQVIDNLKFTFTEPSDASGIFMTDQKWEKKNSDGTWSAATGTFEGGMYRITTRFRMEEPLAAGYKLVSNAEDLSIMIDGKKWNALSGTVKISEDVCLVDVQSPEIEVTHTHSWVETEVLKEATCTENGRGKYKCSICHVEKEEIIWQIPHKYSEELIVDKEPTCTENGWESYHCIYCDVHPGGRVIFQLGHVNGTPVREDEVAPTCGADGSYNEVIYCTRCEEKVSTTPVTVPATGNHDFLGGGVSDSSKEKCIVCDVKNINFSGLDSFVVAENIEYTGDAITSDVTITGLKKDVDYTVENVTKTEIGQYIVKIKGIGNYAGEREVVWQIVPIKGLWVAEIPDQIYTGKAIKPAIEVFDDGVLLTAGKDYTVTYGKNNTNVAQYDAANAKGQLIGPSITITGKGNYTDKKVLYFSIVPCSLSTASVDDMTVAKSTKAIKVAPVVTFDGKKLKAGTDYVISTTTDVSGEITSLQNTGKYTLYVVGKNNYSGYVPFNFTISEKTLTNKVTVAKIIDQKYDKGKQVKPVPVITYKIGGKVTDVSSHFDIEYSNNTEIGTAKVIITAKPLDEMFEGSKTVTFKITGEQINNVKLGIDGKGKISSRVYTGTSYEPVLDLYDGTTPLKKNVDYTVAYSKNVNVGTATATVTGVGKYTGTKRFTYKIDKYDATADASNCIKIKGVDADIVNISVPYEKGGVTPKPDVTMGSMILKENTDYTISYANNKAVVAKDAAKAPAMTITFKGNLSGKKVIKFTITSKDIKYSTITLADKVVSTKANAWKQTAATIVDTNGKKLAAGTDYEKTFKYYKEETCINELTDPTLSADTVVYVKVTGIKNYAGSYIVGKYRISKQNISSAKATIADVEYTGSPIEPKASDITATINSGKTTLNAGTDFEIVPGSYKNNVNKGKASVTIRGINDYCGTKVVTFKIGAKKFLWWKW